MQHLGDITKLDGANVPPVDVIIGGSPCQGLSVAGKQKGLQDDRSCLFLEQIRLVKEMRNATKRTDGIERPRYLVWENVPGAFSSNKGEDFRRVLEEICKVKDERASVPRPTGGGKWRNCGCIVGDGYSIAWRVLDAKFWGTPQRRRRISLVADFRGLTAPEILFERNGLHGNIEESGEEGCGNQADTESSSYEAVGFDSYNQTDTGNVAKTLTGTHTDKDGLPLVFTIDRAAFNQGENTQFRPNISDEDVAPTLTAKGTSAVCFGVPLNFRPENMIPQEEEGATLCNGTAPGTHNGVICYDRIRRHTPLECERLQGFPDNWTDVGDYIDSKGKLRHTSDTARYKALGNSIAIPQWKWVLKRLCAFGYVRDATMASLFDGIGGFPYIWERINGKGSCLWASEIEEFCIAVTKYHFGKGEEK